MIYVRDLFKKSAKTLINVIGSQNSIETHEQNRELTWRKEKDVEKHAEQMVCKHDLWRCCNDMILDLQY